MQAVARPALPGVHAVLSLGLHSNCKAMCCRWLPTPLFLVFMLSWFGSRIYYFPVYVIRSVYYEPINVRPCSLYF